MTTSVLHSSEGTSHGTPSPWVEAGRETMGGIDLDPASWALQNRMVVKARRFFDERTNGYLRPWWGRVWLNPPGGLADDHGRRVISADKTKGRPACTETGQCGLPPGHAHNGVQPAFSLFWAKLITHYLQWEVKCAIVVCFNRNQLTAKGGPLPCNYPFCLPYERVDYLKEVHNEATGLPDLIPGGAPPHTSAFVLLPPFDRVEEDAMVRRFLQTFGRMGRICKPLGVV